MPSFIKELKALKSTTSYATIRRLTFESIPAAAGFTDIRNLKRLKAADRAYRIRVGDYRIGFFFEDDTAIFARVLHRSKIYRFFP
nr:type II toxin-antitoxin system RelE/ParE family toxin [cf. Phormidesmis sp. LEGE 11477]